jgi:hypothetical protein
MKYAQEEETTSFQIVLLGIRRMAINNDKPQRWKQDVMSSVDLYNQWFMRFAPKTFRETRESVTKEVAIGLERTGDLANISPDVLKAYPGILPMLRMATCPPIARDRLVGLAYVKKSLVGTMEDDSRLPARMDRKEVESSLDKIVGTIGELLDIDIFPWLAAKRKATRQERHRASTIVADRLCGAQSDPIIRNAQEERQLKVLSEYVLQKGYRMKAHSQTLAVKEMEPGTFAYRMVVKGTKPDGNPVNIPVDFVIQRMRPKADRIPILIECKSAGDFTNVNKRRKEEAVKVTQIRHTPGLGSAEFVLFLCGYFDTPYLGYEAGEGIDWIWEHRVEDLDELGL